MLDTLSFASIVLSLLSAGLGTLYVSCHSWSSASSVETEISSGGSDVVSSSDIAADTRMHPPPHPVSCLSHSTPIQMLPEAGPGLAVAFVGAEQSEQREVMWGAEQEEGAGAEVRADGGGGHHKLLDLPDGSLSLLSQGILMRAGRKQPLQSLAKVA